MALKTNQHLYTQRLPTLNSLDYSQIPPVQKQRRQASEVWLLTQASSTVIPPQLLYVSHYSGFVVIPMFKSLRFSLCLGQRNSYKTQATPITGEGQSASHGSVWEG